MQDKLEGGAKLMRHCRQCRADAVGLLGEDRGQEFMLHQIPNDLAYDPSKHETHRDVVARERGDHVAAKQAAVASVIGTEATASMLVAVATGGSGRINEHFGHANEFQIYEASSSGILSSATARWSNIARTVRRGCEPGWRHQSAGGHRCGALRQDR